MSYPLVKICEMTVERDLHALIDDVLGDDARRALVAYRRLTIEHLPRLERRAVLAGRRRGDSWAAIGRLLGRSRQSVQQRFDRAFSIDELRAPAPVVSDAEAAHLFYSLLIRDVQRDVWVDQSGDAAVPW